MRLPFVLAIAAVLVSLTSQSFVAPAPAETAPGFGRITGGFGGRMLSAEPIADPVRVQDATTGEFVGRSHLELTEAGDSYTYVVEDVPPGMYKVSALRFEAPTRFAGTWYPNVPEVDGSDAAAVVEVRADETPSGISFSLPRGERLSVPYTWGDGTAVSAECTGRAFADDGLRSSRTATYGSSGFAFGGLSSGDYFVSASCPDEPTRYYDADSPSHSTTVRDHADQVGIGSLATRPGPLAMRAVDGEPVLISIERPSITGSNTVGGTLTASPGTWSLPDPDFRYEWRRGGTLVSQDKTITLKGSDVGTSLSLTVVASKTHYGTGRATALPTPRLPALAPVTSVTRPTITGSVRLGSTLTATPGTWSVPDPALRYEWRRGGVAVAAGRTYRLSGADLGKSISLVVFASLQDRLTGSATSKPTSVLTTPSTLTVRGRGTWHSAVFSVKVTARATVPGGKVKVKSGSAWITGTLSKGSVRLRLASVRPGQRMFLVKYYGKNGVRPTAKRISLRVR